MVAQSPAGVALLPIQPHYANAILRGDKRVEFRRRRFGRDVQYVVVYASSPICGIVGSFRISDVSEGSPDDIWEVFKSVGAIDREDFFRYYAGAELAVAIGIERVCVLAEALPLHELSSSLKAPQSYMYLTQEHVDRLNKLSSELMEG
jgi:predicted transcriptional regulator